MASSARAAHDRGLDVLGFALWTSHDEAKAGMRAAETLRLVYEKALAQHPDAVKYEAQVKPVLEDAKKWDHAWVFYTDAEAVDIGRRAQQLSQKIAAEYSGGEVLPEHGLDLGVAEQLQETGKKAASKAGDVFDFLDYVPWILGIGAALWIGVTVYRAAKKP